MDGTNATNDASLGVTVGPTSPQANPAPGLAITLGTPIAFSSGELLEQFEAAIEEAADRVRWLTDRDVTEVDYSPNADLALIERLEDACSYLRRRWARADVDCVTAPFVGGV